jgi:hypothetical protein
MAETNMNKIALQTKGNVQLQVRGIRVLILLLAVVYSADANLLTSLDNNNNNNNNNKLN